MTTYTIIDSKRGIVKGELKNANAYEYGREVTCKLTKSNGGKISLFVNDDKSGGLVTFSPVFTNWRQEKEFAFVGESLSALLFIAKYNTELTQLRENWESLYNDLRKGEKVVIKFAYTPIN